MFINARNNKIPRLSTGDQLSQTRILRVQPTKLSVYDGGGGSEVSLWNSVFDGVMIRDVS